jgi:co-chaperonin GroES (HSP10)
MEHDVDPAQKLIKELGDISDIEIFNNQILVAVYLRPEKTKTGIYMPDKHREEDKYQSKVGLVVKKGPSAFVDTGDNWFKDVDINLNDWIMYRATDGWSITVNNVLCRMLDDTAVRGRIPHPDAVW